jgi:hypothetical protein
VENPFLGSWVVSEVEGIDLDELESQGSPIISFGANERGEFRFSTYRGGLDYRLNKRSGHTVAEFTWEGLSDGDPVSGRGWVTLRDSKMMGRFFIHLGRDYSFVAEQ